MTKTANNDRDIYRNVSKGMGLSVKAGLTPWQQVWADRPPLYPVDGVDGKPIGGINFLLLTSTGRTEDNRWFRGGSMAKHNLQFAKPEEQTRQVSVIARWPQEYEVEKADGSGEKEIKIAWKSRFNQIYNAEQLTGIDDSIKSSSPMIEGFANPDDLEGLLAVNDAILDLDGDSPVYIYEERKISMPPNDGTLIWYTELVRMIARHTATIEEDESLFRQVASTNGRIGHRELLTTELATYMIAAEIGLPFQPAIDGISDKQILEFVEKNNNGTLFKMAAKANNIRRYVSDLVMQNNLDLESSGETFADMFSDDQMDQPSPIEITPQESASAPVVGKVKAPIPEIADEPAPKREIRKFNF